MRQQDIVWVRLPFSSFDAAKVRPALVVSNNSYNAENKDVIVCAITSKLDQKRFSVFINNDDVLAGKLPLKSRIRADKIMQIEKSLVVSTFAALKDKSFDKVVTEIMKLVSR